MIFGKGGQHAQKGTTEPLNLTITLGVVRLRQSRQTQTACLDQNAAAREERSNIRTHPLVSVLWCTVGLLVCDAVCLRPLSKIITDY